MYPEYLIIPQLLPEKIKLSESPTKFGYKKDYHLLGEIDGTMFELAYINGTWEKIAIEASKYVYPKVKLQADMQKDTKFKEKIEQLGIMYNLFVYPSTSDKNTLFYYAKNCERSKVNTFPALYKLTGDTLVKIEEIPIQNTFISYEFDEESEISARQFIKDLQILSEIYAAKQLKEKVKNSKDFYIISETLLDFHCKGLALIPIDEDYNFIYWKIPFMLKIIFSKNFSIKFTPTILPKYKEAFRLRLHQRFNFITGKMHRINVI